MTYREISGPGYSERQLNYLKSILFIFFIRANPRKVKILGLKVRPKCYGRSFFQKKFYDQRQILRGKFFKTVVTVGKMVYNPNS